MIEKKVMRDVFMDGIHGMMATDERIFLLSADFGSPRLDRIRQEFGDRFINTGIAEQNLINVAAGLALEGYTVYAYAIAPFLTMRAYEQIRVNVCLHSQLRSLNINLLGVGAGLSYDVSGPTHHCLEDLSIMRTLPNMAVFSPGDWYLAEKLASFSAGVPGPKYFRFDGKPVMRIYDEASGVSIGKGFHELKRGNEVCVVSTGYMTHTALKAHELLKNENIEAGVIDFFCLSSFDRDSLHDALKDYGFIVTIEEGFIKSGGLDSLIAFEIEAAGGGAKLRRMGFEDRYVFDIGSRESLHGRCGLGALDLASAVKKLLQGV